MAWLQNLHMFALRSRVLHYGRIIAMVHNTVLFGIVLRIRTLNSRISLVAFRLQNLLVFILDAMDYLLWNHWHVV